MIDIDCTLVLLKVERRIIRDEIQLEQARQGDVLTVADRAAVDDVGANAAPGADESVGVGR
jgi:hypothetical protein